MSRCAPRALVRAALALALLAGSAAAHEMRPAYLELREIGPERFEVLWKTPARGELRLALDAVLPATCEPVEATTRVLRQGAALDRWVVDCPGGLAGGRVEIAGLEGTLTDALVRVLWADGRVTQALLRPEEPVLEIGAASSWSDVARNYLRLGAEHILSGYDHLLFLLALMLLVKSRRSLFWTITAFTLAHSVTLSAAALGFVHVPPPPVEATIALSIVFVAAELERSRRGGRALAERRPWLVSFSFGLLHGLGFAGALSEVGLPDTAIPTALAFFNVGVEVGQLAFVGVALGLLVLLRRARVPWPARLRALPAYAIGAVASLWTIERIVSFF